VNPKKSEELITLNV